jgi:3-hydroxymyristoyl/3-hydroxydecanoyl-(acyl carrier protein) dehydratases
MSGADFQREVCIDVAHAALPGHFPGHPLVPAVILLEQVALALRAWRNQRLARVLEAKFVGPLLPGQAAQLRLSQAPSAADGGERVRFEIQREGNLLARGVVEGTA